MEPNNLQDYNIVKTPEIGKLFYGNAANYFIIQTTTEKYILYKNDKVYTSANTLEELMSFCINVFLGTGHLSKKFDVKVGQKYKNRHGDQQLVVSNYGKFTLVNITSYTYTDYWSKLTKEEMERKLKEANFTLIEG